MNNIKKLREAIGMSQSALADKLGVRPPAVWKWENEVSPPKYENLLAMAKLFCCSMDHVMGQDTIGA